MTSLTDLEYRNAFIRRHVGPDEQQQQAMLKLVNASTIDALTNEIVPRDIQLNQALQLEDATPEHEAISYLKAIAGQNKVFKNYIGMGYYDTLVPNVILRNVLENPGWYTAYTPYQPEIAQGRLEALINYQQMVIDLTGMELANASLLDEATAAAEGMAMAKRTVRKNKSNAFYVDDKVLPQTLDVLRTRAEYYGYDIIVGPIAKAAEEDVFAALIQYPGVDGNITDPEPIIQALKEKNAMSIVATDLLALCLLKTPGEMGADIVIGNSQRFGVPMGYGGPHAAFFATLETHKRTIPGRIIGVSKDANNKPAYRMALQTREQHIRREKATSNICTAQVLLANMAGFYAVYHGPEGLKRIAKRVHRLTGILSEGLVAKGIRVLNSHFFDTLTIDPLHNHEIIVERAAAANINLREDKNGYLGISVDETTSREDIEVLFDIFLGDHDLNATKIDDDLDQQDTSFLPEALERQSDFFNAPCFQ